MINAVKEHFCEPAMIDTDEVQSMDNWDMTAGLNKTKTKASGSAQLIPDEIHNQAWSKTEKYAKNKYGNDYGSIKRYHKFAGVLQIYKFK